MWRQHVWASCLRLTAPLNLLVGLAREVEAPTKADFDFTDFRIVRSTGLIAQFIADPQPAETRAAIDKTIRPNMGRFKPSMVFISGISQSDRPMSRVLPAGYIVCAIAILPAIAPKRESQCRSRGQDGEGQAL